MAKIRKGEIKLKTKIKAFDKNGKNFFEEVSKKKKLRAAKSRRAGILKVKAMPKKRAEAVKEFRLEGLKSKKAKMVGKSIKISALAILPSIRGIEVRVIKIKRLSLEKKELKNLRDSL